MMVMSKQFPSHPIQFRLSPSGLHFISSTEKGAQKTSSKHHGGERPNYYTTTLLNSIPAKDLVILDLERIFILNPIDESKKRWNNKLSTIHIIIVYR